MTTKEINAVDNYYGGICLKEDENGNPLWCIEDWTGHNWKPCPDYVYKALIRLYEEEQKHLVKY